MKINIQSAWSEKEMVLIPTIGIGFRAKSIYAVWLFWAVDVELK